MLEVYMSVFGALACRRRCFTGTSKWIQQRSHQQFRTAAETCCTTIHTWEPMYHQYYTRLNCYRRMLSCAEAYTCYAIRMPAVAAYSSPTHSTTAVRLRGSEWADIGTVRCPYKQSASMPASSQEALLFTDIILQTWWTEAQANRPIRLPDSRPSAHHQHLSPSLLPTLSLPNSSCSLSLCQ